MIYSGCNTYGAIDSEKEEYSLTVEKNRAFLPPARLLSLSGLRLPSCPILDSG